MENKLIYSQSNFEDDINLAEVIIKELLLIIDDSHDELKSLLRDILSLIGYEKSYELNSRKPTYFSRWMN
jgi:hypothetical protein